MNDFFNITFNIGLFHYLILALFLFLLGLLGAIVSKNILKVLICIEFMLTAVNINFVSFAAYLDPEKLNGLVFALFYTALGAVEIAILLAIFYIMFKSKQSVDVEDYKELKG